MIPDGLLVMFVIAIVVIISFVLASIRRGNFRLIHKLYFLVSMHLIVWLVALIGINFTNPDNTTALYVWDAIMYLGGSFAPVYSLLIALTFVKGLEKFPKRYYLFFVVPLYAVAMVWTNPLHHQFYKVFSVLAEEV